MMVICKPLVVKGAFVCDVLVGVLAYIVYSIEECQITKTDSNNLEVQLFLNEEI